MAITLARIDDRVIHGQTVTRWAASRPCNAILVISDKVAADELRKKVLKAAAGALKLGIYTVEQGLPHSRRPSPPQRASLLFPILWKSSQISSAKAETSATS